MCGIDSLRIATEKMHQACLFTLNMSQDIPIDIPNSQNWKIMKAISSRLVFESLLSCINIVRKIKEIGWTFQLDN